MTPLRGHLVLALEHAQLADGQGYISISGDIMEFVQRSGYLKRILQTRRRGHHDGGVL